MPVSAPDMTKTQVLKEQGEPLWFVCRLLWSVLLHTHAESRSECVEEEEEEEASLRVQFL